MKLLKHILIVEDDVLLATDMKRNLTSEGWIISGIARNLTAAVEIMTKENVDLALIDMTLDGPEDGVATALELQKIKWIPVIYMTGTTPMELKARVSETFPAAFLEKPLRMKELAIQIELALNNFHGGYIPNPQKTHAEFIFLPTNSGLVRVKINEIVYIKAERNNSQLFLTTTDNQSVNNPQLFVTINKGRIFQELPSNFFALSRSLVLNLNHILTISTDTIYMQSHALSIPEGRRKDLLDQLVIIKK